MNILHLKYVVEVEKTQSINKAAEALFMGQPNLSRAIKELEESLGITIFKRTSKGILPTEQGEKFLLHAKSILQQIEEIEALYNQEKSPKLKLNISVPRASYISHAFTELVKEMDRSNGIELNFKETNSFRTVKNLTENEYHLGVIRFQAIHEQYFQTMLKAKDLAWQELWEFSYLILTSGNSPLGKLTEVTLGNLNDLIEVTHGDPYIPYISLAAARKEEFLEPTKNRIFVYERGSQFDLLSNVHSTYMWVSPVPKSLLESHRLIQKTCSDNKRKYKDLLIYRKGHKLSPLEESFVDKLYKTQKEAVDNTLDKSH